MISNASSYEFQFFYFLIPLHQVEVTSALLVCGRIFFSASDTMKKGYNQLTQELLFLNEIRILWSGDQIRKMTKKWNASEVPIKSNRSPKGSEYKPLEISIPEHSNRNFRIWNPLDHNNRIENYDGVEHSDMSLYNSDTRAMCKFLQIVSDLLDIDTYLSDTMSIQEIYKEGDVDEVKIDTINSKAASSVTLAVKCFELQLVAESLLKSCSSSTPHTTSSSSSSSSSSSTVPTRTVSSSTTAMTTIPSLSTQSGLPILTRDKEKEKEIDKNQFSLPLSSSMKSWISLLTAKAVLCSIGNHQVAYNWARKSLSYASPRSFPDTLKLKLKLKTASNSGGCLSVDKCHPRIEVR